MLDFVDPKLPGGLYMPTVSTASDEQLAAQLPKALQTIKVLLAEWDAVPDEDGYASPEWYERANRDRSMHPTESNVRRMERLARAIRKELAERAEREVRAREAKLADAKARLERLAEDGPAEVGRLAQQAQVAVEASNRVRAFIADLRIMGGATRLAEEMQRVRTGHAVAAHALGKTPSADCLGTQVPEGLPTSQEVSQVLAVLLGRGGFDTSWRGGNPDAARADELARVLRDY